MKKQANNIDLIIYLVLVGLLALYALYIKGTCEGLGCLAAVLPIIGILFLSVVECIVNIIYFIQRRSFNALRKIIFILTMLILILTGLM